MSDRFEELQSELRQTAGREIREEAAEDERLTELQRQRHLELIDVAKEAAHAGHRVTAEFGGKAFSGAIGEVGADYLVIHTADQIIEIVLDTAIWSFTAAPIPPTEPLIKSGTFLAKLSEHAAEDRRIRVELRDGQILMGTFRVIGTGQAEMSDAEGRSVHVPVGLIAAIIRGVR